MTASVGRRKIGTKRPRDRFNIIAARSQHKHGDWLFNGSFVMNQQRAGEPVRDARLYMQPTIIGIGIVRSDDRFLVGVRGPRSTLAGLAEFPGGKLEPGETIQQCVQRECLEETGLNVTVGELLLRKRHEYKHGIVDLRFYACASDPDPASLRGSFRWVTKTELCQLTFPEANAEVLTLL